MKKYILLFFILFSTLAYSQRFEEIIIIGDYGIASDNPKIISNCLDSCVLDIYNKKYVFKKQKKTTAVLEYKTKEVHLIISNSIYFGVYFVEFKTKYAVYNWYSLCTWNKNE